MLGRLGSVPARVTRAILLAALFCSLVRAAALSAGGSEYSVDVWDTDRGMPGSAVTCVAEAPDGHLWIGSYEGLASFDGFRFTVVNRRNTPGFPSDAVTSLLVDHAGELWAGTGDGIAHRQKGQWRVYPGPNGAPLRFATYMVEESPGRILAVAGRNQLYALTAGQFVSIPAPPQVHYLKIYAVPGEGVWGSSESFLGRLRNGRWEEIALPPDLKNLLGTAPGRTHGIWAAGQDGIRHYQNGSWSEPFAYPPGLRFLPPVTMLEDAVGNLWAGDYRSGLMLLRKDGSAQRFGRAQGLPNQTIRSLFEGSAHGLWAATDGGGLVRFRPRTVTMFDEDDGLSHSVVDSVFEDPPGTLLIGTYGGGLVRFDENARQFGQPVVAPAARLTAESLVLTVLSDRHGTVWAGTYGHGIFRLKDGRTEQIAETEGWVVNALFLDSRQVLWAGYQRGLASYEKGKLTAHDSEAGRPQKEIGAIAEDSHGSIWAGGAEGLFRLGENRFDKFAPPGVREYDHVNALYADSGGALWIGAEDRGLDLWQNGKFTAFGPAQGLVASRIANIVDDNEGRLWLGTQRQGLVGVTRASLDAIAGGSRAQVSVVWLTREEGLATNQIRSGFQPSAGRSADGRLWFATLKGLALVDPRQAWQVPPPAPVRIEEVAMGNRRIPFEQIEGDTLIVPPGSRRLSVVFTQPNFSDPERSRFQYRLDGLDPSWTDAPERSAAVGNLRPGHYVFRVRAGNTGGIWNSGAALNLDVQPYFWETIWFRTVVALLLIASTGVAVYGLQSFKLKRKSEQLEREKALRRDIERMQEGLKVSEERFAKAFNSSPFPMTINTLTDGRFVDVNQRFLERAGLRREEVIGRSRSELDLWVKPAEAARFADAIRHNQRVRNFEAQMKAANGQSAYCLLSAEVIELDGAQCVLVISDEVTERKLLEEQLHQSQKLESIGRLAGGVAHDFNNLLTVINGYSDLVLARLDSQDPNWMRVDQIRKAGVRAAELTGQLLAFSRKQVIKPSPLDVNALIQETEPMLRRLMPESIEIALRLSEAPVRVMADAGQLNQVLINLAVNARDAMPEGGVLEVETSRVDVNGQSAGPHAGLPHGPYVLLAFSDNGAGMNEEVRKHVFEPFFTTKKKGAGTGLGLATVYGIVRQNGGWILVCSEPEQGTTFSIYLPRVESAAEKAAFQAKPVASRWGEETVLVVEDQPNVRELAREVLESYGYSVLDAGQGSEALHIAASHKGPIHLMLTDVVMPGMTGKELAERIKPLRPSTKVLFMSGYNENVIVKQGVIDASINFIAKPLAPDELAAKVREVLGPPVTE